jgi:hypothetical protein
LKFGITSALGRKGNKRYGARIERVLALTIRRASAI